MFTDAYHLRVAQLRRHRLRRGDGRADRPRPPGARRPTARSRVHVGAGAGPPRGDALHVPWRALERALLPQHGFTDLAPADWTPGMHVIREQEAEHGLRTEARVFMRRDLGPARSTVW